MKKEYKKPAIVIAILIIVAIVFVVFFRSGGIIDSLGEVQKTVEVNQDGRTIRVGSDGLVEYIDEDGNSFFLSWSGGKAQAFLSYFEDNYGESSASSPEGGIASYSLSNDELMSIVIGEIENGGSGGGGSEGENITQYFDNDDGGGGGSGGSGGSSGGNGSSPTAPPAGRDDGCLYWKLSYCVRARTPEPTPVPAPQGEVLPPDCAQNIITGRTVIGNELCLTTPTPNP